MQLPPENQPAPWHKILNIFVPPGLGPHLRRRARISAALLLLGFVVPLVGATFIPAMTRQPSILTIVGGIAASRLVLLALLRWGQLVTLVAHLVLATFLVFLLSLGVLAGGPAAPSIVVAPLIPAIATLLLSNRGGALWAALTFAATAAITFVDFTPLTASVSPWGPLDWLGRASPEGTHLRGAFAAFATIFGWVVAALYEHDRLEQVRAIDAARSQAVAATHAKSRFLANMSHEIRTPMSGVVGIADLLAETELSAEQRRLVSVLRSSGKGMVALLNDILDMSRIEAGELSLEQAPVSLAPLLQDVVRALSVAVDPRKLSLTVSIDESVPDAIVTDQLRLRQLLTNLVSNAVKFTEQGHVHVRLRSTPVDAESVSLLLTVEDTGIGMAPDTLRRVLAPFQQADASTTRRYGGTGLGLTISRHLAAALGGSLALTSTLGEGTTASVELTVFTAAPPEPSPSPHRAQQSSARVLLVEDDPVSRQVGHLLLERLGATVTTAEDGHSALAAVESGTFDLILMDVHMPRLDGLETTRRLRAQGHRSVPIVALTASAFAEDQAACEAAGMTGYLPKPARLDALAGVLAAHGLCEPVKHTG